MRNLKFKHLRIENFMCFGAEGIEIDFETLGNIVLVRGENLDVISEDGTIASNGSGKCFGKGTLILMYDGTIKKVEDIKVNDLVMGDDSSPRRVLSLANGREKLFKIIPSKGDPYIVNESHILTLKSSSKKYERFKNHFSKQGDIFNISVKDYIKQSKSYKHLMRGYRAPIEFKNNNQKLLIDPYFLGLWLGDGTSASSSITNKDKAIVNVIRKEAKKRGLLLRIDENQHKKCPTYCRNSLLNDLIFYNLINNKHIPLVYKTANRKDRLELLAGILDSDGHSRNNCFDFISKYKTLAEDVAYLARSLGLAAYISDCLKTCQTGARNKYFRVSISGDCSIIPNRIKYKKCSKRKINKDPLVVGIKVKELECGEYYGFEIDGNKLFLLGDFTVVHNSSVPDAIVYGLYGKPIKNPKKLSHANLINHESKKKLQIELIWDDYRLVRTRKPDGLRLWQSPEGKWDEETEITLGGIPTTQKYIEEKIIGLNYETFINIFIFSDDNTIPFLECDTNSKREIVENLLGLEKYRDYSESAKAKVKQLKEDIRLLTSEYSILKDDVTSKTYKVTQLGSQKNEWEQNKRAEFERILEAIKRKKDELEKDDEGLELSRYKDAQEEIAELKEALPKIQEEKDKLNEIIEASATKVREKNKVYQELLTKQNTVERNCTGIQHQILRTKQSLQETKKKEGKECPYCFGMIKEENLSHVLEKLRKDLDEQEILLPPIQAELNLIVEESKGVYESLEKCERLNSKARDQFNQKQKEINDVVSKITELSKIKEPKASVDKLLIQQQIDTLKAKSIDLEQEIEHSNPFDQLLLEAKKELQVKETSCSDKKAQIDLKENDLPYYDFWVKAFGDKGIRKYIIDGIIPTLNTRLEHLLQFLVDNKIKLEFNNELEQKIDKYPFNNKPYVYHGMSGGQRRRLNLGISQAWAYVRMLSCGISPSIMFLDEVTTNMDEIGVQCIYRFICELAKEKQVFIIDHDKDLLEMLHGCDLIHLQMQNEVTKRVN